MTNTKFSTGNIFTTPGVARHVPLGEIASALTGLPPNHVPAVMRESGLVDVTPLALRSEGAC